MHIPCIFILVTNWRLVFTILNVQIGTEFKFRKEEVIRMSTKINEYLNCHKSTSFNELLFSLIDEGGYKDSEIYKKVDIDRKLFSKIRCNNEYIPRRNVIIKLCLALELPKSEFNKLLNSAGYSLTNNKFDQIVSYCLDNNVYDLHQINNYLYTFCNASL